VIYAGVWVNDCYKIAADIVLKSWQRYWDNEKKGRSTYDFIPVVGTKVIFPSKRFSGAVYCRMLLHDTMLKKRQLQNWYCRHSYMRLWKCIGNNRTFVTLLQQIWQRKKRYVSFYISVWHHYEAKSKFHNNRSIVVVTIMWQACKHTIQQNCQRSTICIFGQS